MLTQADIDEINYLVISGESDKAVEMLITITGCTKSDALNFVDELAIGGNFEELLNKHWIEDYSKRKINIESNIKFSSEEKRALLKIFLPMALIFIGVVLIIVYSL